MPYVKQWYGPHLTLHCPNCQSDYRVTLHEGLRACPHGDGAMGDCNRCNAEAMAEGTTIPAATPSPLPEPPPPPPWWNPPPQVMTQEERDLAEAAFQNAKANIPDSMISQEELDLGPKL